MELKERVGLLLLFFQSTSLKSASYEYRQVDEKRSIVCSNRKTQPTIN
jgi:hypothetical protein